MRAKLLIFPLLFIVSTISSLSLLYSGDLAQFVDLGFSADGNYYMFGEHGYKTEEGAFYSNIYLVDTERNTFVTGGIFNGKYLSNIEPGQSSNGALFKLLQETESRQKQYKIDFLRKGVPLYIYLGDPIEPSDSYDPNTIAFDDIEGNLFETRLVVNQEGGMGSSVRSSFKIEVRMTSSSGRGSSFDVGHPNYWRDGVKTYKIERVLQPRGQRVLIFVIQKEQSNLGILYMIETLRY